MNAPATASGPVAADPWRDALLAARLLALDPAALGGVVLRGGAGPAREAWLSALQQALPDGAPVRRLPSRLADDSLLGGIDLEATLACGAPRLQPGVLAACDGGVAILPLAERAEPGLAARLVQVLDQGEVVLEREGLQARLPARLGLVALDEGGDDDPPLAPGLADRLAIHLDLDALDGAVPPAAPARNAGVPVVEAWDAVPDGLLSALVTTAEALGIVSGRAPLLALRVARAAARLARRSGVTAEDAALAVRLVLAPRARILPGAPDEAEAPEPPPPSSADTPPPSEADSLSSAALAEMLCAAAQTALPPDLLAALQAGRSMRQGPAPRDGDGRNAPSLRRGRPAGSRAGRLRGDARLALADTLRAAAPWQRLRRLDHAGPAIAIRPGDVRLRRFIQRRASSIVFCVDASGSAAFDRLGEAKGAVELLLADAYARRTFAALVVFRGSGATLVLPPTRSLSRARALLAEQVGGGGTPLAAGLRTGAELALAERKRGRTPLLVVLTDGRANVGLAGPAPRAVAMAEAEAAARLAAVEALPAIVIDTASRARGEGAALAAWLGARHVALPRVEAGAVRDAVRLAVP